MKNINYPMESKDESIRLDLKTDLTVIKQQALWAGIKPGMRVVDIGCGPGKITSTLYKLASPDGSATGIDGSENRLDYARNNYGSDGIEFVCKNILEPLKDLGTFDFVWIRFVLEYFRVNAHELLNNVSKIINPGGILCLIDLDHNPFNHFGFPDRLNKVLHNLIDIFEKEYNFDPYMGRKLYSYMYDLGYENIDVDVSINSLVFGKIKEIDYYNWIKKTEAIPKLIEYDFHEYEKGYEGFIEEFEACIKNPRRFSYSPLICCRGQKSML